jgi:hypothetical protein
MQARRWNKKITFKVAYYFKKWFFKNRTENIFAFSNLDANSTPVSDLHVKNK